MVNIQMMPGTGRNPMTVNGRGYNCPVNGVLSVPDFDATVLESNGWVRSGSHGSGVTTGRPTTGLFKGYEYFDNTLGLIVIWDGLVWRNHTNGALA
jgi:hypothetical protein